MALIGVLVVLTVIGAAVACGSSTTTTNAARTGSPTTPTSGDRTPTTPPTATRAAKTATSPDAQSSPGRSGTKEQTALAVLETLPIKGRAPKTGYSRDRFGDGWLMVNGCNTRDRTLQRDLTRKTLVDGSTCEVESGHLNDPYTAAAIRFVRGGGSEVDIDHVVALGDAWQKGAQRWSEQRRVKFANDPLELLSVDAGANRQKGDGDAATWLPPNKAFRCDYIARQIAVKDKYGAWVTQAEHDAMSRVLARCPDQKLPKSGRVRVRVKPTHSAGPKQPTPAPTTEGAPAPSGEGREFANCDAVRAAGLAPLRRGTPDYVANPRLDRDKDGVACE